MVRGYGVGAVALLCGIDASWLGDSQRSRLRRRIREASVEELVARARDRAVVQRYAGHPSAVSRVRAATVSTHLAARCLGLADVNAVDAYLSADAVDEVVRRHGLVADAGGSFTLRATTMDMRVVANVGKVGAALAALDLAESLDVRERSAGVRGLEEALEAFCDSPSDDRGPDSARRVGRPLAKRI